MSISPSVYVRDGHVFNVRVAEGGLIGSIECPGEGKCQAWNKPEDGPPFCFVTELVGHEGWQEFTEWQNRSDGEYLTADFPVEIEWTTTGLDDDWELFWRPIPTAASNMRQGLNALLRHFPGADVAGVINQNDALRDIMASVDPPPFDFQPIGNAGPWTCVDLVLAGKPLRFAIWNNTGTVFRIGEDGAVVDDPFIEVRPT